MQATETKHTPGPWVVEDFAHESQQIIRAPSDHDATVAFCRDFGTAEFPVAVTLKETRKANARLIAAAPELLAALKNALNDLIRLQGGAGIEFVCGIIPELRAAIAKAEGR